jgi:hypothetical protein
MLTLNQIVEQLNEVQRVHANIKSFYFGELWDFNASGSIDYPAMAVTYEGSQLKRGELMYSFNVYIMDVIDKGLSVRTEAISDTLQTCTDIIAILDMTSDFPAKVNTSVKIDDFTDRFVDEVTGNWFRLDITTPYVFDKCAIPTNRSIVYQSELLVTDNDLTSLTESLVSFWKGNSNGNDEQGLNNATAQNGATYAAGLIDQAFSLDGVNDYFDVGTNKFNYTTDFSVSAWVYKTSNNNFAILSNYSQEATITRGWSLRVVSYNNFNISFFNEDIEYALVGGNATNNTWYHVAFTYSTTGGRVLYVNGVEVSSTPNTTAPNYSTALTQIGNQDTPNFPFSGRLQYIRVYNKRLTSNDILNLYNSGTPI